MKKDAVIIGGGVAGAWCASELSRLGLESIIVEKDPYPGGHVAGYCCKATDKCQRCGACLLEDVLGCVEKSDRITCLLRSTVTQVNRANGFFNISIFQQPLRIHLEKCNLCGKCMEICPVPGALTRLPDKNCISLNEDSCIFFKDGSCQACADACPEGAVDLKVPAGETQVDARAIILACGFKAFDPREKPRFGYGLIPGVITSLELDSILRGGNFDPGEGEKKIKSVAFIQCVGSRDPKIGRNYCSRVCCGYALRLAGLLGDRFPGIQPAIFFMDIQSFDRDFERRFEAIRRKMRLIRAIPGEVRSGTDGRPELIYRGPGEERIVESFDLVVLSVGISPDPSLGALAELLGVNTNEDGFLGRGGDEVFTDTSGVFVAGAIQGPKSIEETVSHAIRTAGAVESYVKEHYRGENQ